MLIVGPFAITGDWDTTPTPPGLLRLRFVPSFALSNGWSLWTQAGLLAVAAHVAPGMSVMDIGTGSGILAIAAATLGAQPVFATDIHPEALAAARANCALNAVQVTVLETDVVPQAIDLAVISISTAWALVHRPRLTAATVLVVEDDTRVSVYARDEKVEEYGPPSADLSARYV